ncbi:MAG TPA: ribosome small subunit-dependent GTPase A [Tepidisphaeraceae bacterium]
MAGRKKKGGNQKDLTSSYLDGDMDEDRVEAQQRFGDKTKHYQRDKTIKTQAGRPDAEIDALPGGEVIQVHSLYSDVLTDDGTQWRCVQRKTLARVSATQMVVGDFVRFSPSPELNDVAKNEGVVERIEPRRTVLTRADSFKQQESHPIVANAERMLIVASLHLPEVKWGLIDRMVIAAESGGLEPVLCLNKVDTAEGDEDLAAAQIVLDHYASMGITSLKTCVPTGLGLDELKDVLSGRVTVLAGHSGVGKSSLIRAIEPTLDLRVGEISAIHSKGMHTTTSARKFPLTFGGHVIDTPGVKLFGLWAITRQRLAEFFPDVEAGTAPDWRTESYERILESLPPPGFDEQTIDPDRRRQDRPPVEEEEPQMDADERG